jgi:hypothetical protein|tara:strand:+ start:4663 stop:5073 length:411 start_codon:yes stop_codon:yes gene_type:complete
MIRNYIMKELITETNNLLALMRGNLHSWYVKSEYAGDNPEAYADERMDGIHYIFEEGRNYIKLLKTEESDFDGSLRSSVVGFIVKKSPKAIDNKTNEKFKIGDMLMAAGYNAPATNFARGNILEGYNEARVRWTGV